jgi:hypothetical protein
MRGRDMINLSTASLNAEARLRVASRGAAWAGVERHARRGGPVPTRWLSADSDLSDARRPRGEPRRRETGDDAGSLVGRPAG